MDETKEIPLETIYWKEPTDITEEQIRNMAASILVHGQIEPIVVDIRDEKGYRGVVGRLRYEGMKNRWSAEPEGKTIQARIHKFRDETEIKMWQLAENLHRRKVAPMQRAWQYRQLYDLIREEHDEAATINTLVTAIESCTGNKESMKTVQHYLSLTKLEHETQQILTSEKMTLRHGLELLRLKDPEKQVEAAKTAQEDKLTVKELGYVVESVTVKERQERQKKRLEKKAEELRSLGKTVYLDTPYVSYEQHRKDSDTYKRFWGEIPKKCQTCPKKGVLLSGNFQQKPICTDLKCYEELSQQKSIDLEKERKARQETFEQERSKILEMKPDERIWRLTVFGSFDTFRLTNILELERRGDLEEKIWEKLCSMSMEECQKLLIREAVKKVLTGPQGWRGNIVKKWAVKEFNLTPEVFLAKEE